MLTGDLKDILIEKVTTFLNQHRQRREKARDLVQMYKRDGTLAREMWKRDFSKS
jgi:tryptophanyl-tRNA synthetase